MKDKDSNFPKWSEQNTLERVLSVLSWLILIGSGIVYSISFFSNIFGQKVFTILLPLVSISIFMNAYVYRKRKATMIFCLVCGVALILMGIVLLLVFR